MFSLLASKKKRKVESKCFDFFLFHWQRRHIRFADATTVSIEEPADESAVIKQID
jgi:hypothetical protein